MTAGITKDFAQAISHNQSYTGITPKGDTITWNPGDPLPDPAPDGGVGAGTTGVDKFKNCDLSRLVVGSYRYCYSYYVPYEETEPVEVLDLSAVTTSNIRDMRGMFSGCSNVKKLNLSSFDTSKVRMMGEMFQGCSSLTSLDLSSFNTSEAVSMWGMFSGCSSLTSLNITSFDTSKVYDMNGMFSGCSSLTDLDISRLNTSGAYKMNEMFKGCSGLTSLNLSSFDTSKVGNFSSMFDGCSNLDSLDLTAFDFSAALGSIRDKEKKTEDYYSEHPEDHPFYHMFDGTCSSNSSGNARVGIVKSAYSADVLNSPVTGIDTSKLKFSGSGASAESISLSTSSLTIYPYSEMLWMGNSPIQVTYSPSDAVFHDFTCSVEGSDHIFVDLWEDRIHLWADGEGTATLTVTSIETGKSASCEITATGDFSRRDSSGEIKYFDDVSDSSDYYFEPVYWAKYYDITSGTGSRTVTDGDNTFTINDFSPEGEVRRGQMITFLYRYYKNLSEKSTEHYGTDKTYSNPFTDVGVKYYTDPISWAYANGITRGTGDGRFSPDKPVTRAQMVTFLCRAGEKFGNIDENNITASKAFTDIKANQYYTKPVAWAAAAGVASGYANGTFGPNDVCTRAQGVTFLFRSDRSDQLMK